MKKPTNDARLEIRLPANVKAKAEKAAKKQGKKSLAHLVRDYLETLS